MILKKNIISKIMIISNIISKIHQIHISLVIKGCM